MRTQVTYRGLDASLPLTGTVERELVREVGKYFNDVEAAHVTFTRAGALFGCSMQLQDGKQGVMVQSQGQHADCYKAFREANQHAVKQLRRHKRRLVARWTGSGRRQSSSRPL